MMVKYKLVLSALVIFYGFCITGETTFHLNKLNICKKPCKHHLFAMIFRIALDISRYIFCRLRFIDESVWLISALCIARLQLHRWFTMASACKDLLQSMQCE